MTHRLLVFSKIEANFVMEIIASPSTTFLELHNLILNACNYRELSGQAFFICDENWKIKEKIYLQETSSIGYDEDINLMKSSFLDDFIEEEGQHIAYIYEPSQKNILLIELTQNTFGESTEKAHISRVKGTPPSQFDDNCDAQPPETETKTKSASARADEEYSFSEETFSEDEIDIDGFEVSEI